jgi:hypothetical protein
MRNASEQVNGERKRGTSESKFDCAVDVVLDLERAEEIEEIFVSRKKTFAAGPVADLNATAEVDVVRRLGELHDGERPWRTEDVVPTTDHQESTASRRRCWYTGSPNSELHGGEVGAVRLVGIEVADP